MITIKDLLKSFKKDVENETLFPEIILHLKDISSTINLSDTFLEEKQKAIEKIILKEFFHLIKYGLNFSKILSPSIERIEQKNIKFEDIFETDKKYLQIYLDFSLKLEELFNENRFKSLNLFILYDLIYIKLKYKHFLPYILLKFLSDEFYSFLSSSENEKQFLEDNYDFNNLKIDFNKAFANLLFLLKYNLYFVISTSILKTEEYKKFLEDDISVYYKEKKISKLSKKDSNTLSFWQHFFIKYNSVNINKEEKASSQIFNKIFEDWRNFHETNEDLVEIINLIIFSAKDKGLIFIEKERTVSIRAKYKQIDKQFIFIGPSLINNLTINSLYRRIQLPFVCKPKDYVIKKENNFFYIVGGFYTEQMLFDFPYRDKNKI
jgi:hypothetical protein